MGKLPPELQPKHKILQANPTVRSDFLEKVQVGFITPHRASVERFVEDGVILTNGTKLEVDEVISCTGYLVRLRRMYSERSPRC
jgi:dimethylaniline monooxygenase (N-oxide forming)